MGCHLEQTAQQDMDRIGDAITRMAALSAQALRDGMRALATGNRMLAYSVIIRDQRIDAMEKTIDRLCLEFLVRQQPVAGLLRFAYGAIRVNLELERVGDYAESIARQVLKLISLGVQVPTERFAEIADLSVPMLTDAARAFVARDAERARLVMEVEETVDGLKSRLNQDLVERFGCNQIPFAALNACMMIARRLERVSDQARNICRETVYASTGEDARHPDSGVYRVLFVESSGGNRVAMAESAARRFGGEAFHFASASLDPQPVAAPTAEFLRARGADAVPGVPHGLLEVPELDHYHIVIALDADVKRVFPKHARRIVFLDWPVADPAGTSGGAAEVRAAHEEVARFLDGHLRDLVDAIGGVDRPNAGPGGA
ncbi:MAG: phosphate signaling complex protein PhoU [Lentisphaerae bacterium]|nr:phosphate signaling complex protein PhoU [Lentisphaerota bacterium]